MTSKKALKAIYEDKLKILNKSVKNLNFKVTDLVKAEEEILEIDADDTIVFANLKRTYGLYSYSNDQGKDKIGKKSAFKLSTQQGFKPLLVEVYPTRQGSIMDYSFELWNRPFKLTSEAYFKNLSDVNSYTIDNVRIRYRADNVTKAYVYGLDLRLNGEFVPGSESWVSLGLLKTEENINDNGYIARPSDQRIKFGILFQDYVPNLPNLKAYLNLVYNSGVPGGSPSYADPYNFQQRLRDYRRADLGVSYIFVDDNNKQINTGLLSNFKEFSVGLELFNIFDIQNAITNTWVRDVYSKTQFGIPNYMTGRVLNFKVAMKF